MDIAVSSFGGLDLSSIPGVYNWMNITMTWLLGQVRVRVIVWVRVWFRVRVRIRVREEIRVRSIFYPWCLCLDQHYYDLVVRTGEVRARVRVKGICR
jgi:hypothetical protein